MADDAARRLFEKFNEPVIPMASIEKWLGRFEESDRPAAIKLLEQIEFHSQPRLIRETRMLHERVRKRLAAGGFDAEGLSDVDFSREFTCKSGDVVSYIYRRANLIPTADFRTFDELSRLTEKNHDDFSNRALIILDDYIGTGSQFLFHFIGRNEEDIRVVKSYKKLYLVCYIVHQSALEKFWMLADGMIDEVIERGQKDFPDIDFSEDFGLLRRLLSLPDWRNIELIYLDVDVPLLSDENKFLNDEDRKEIERLLEKLCH